MHSFEEVCNDVRGRGFVPLLESRQPILKNILWVADNYFKLSRQSQGQAYYDVIFAEQGSNLLKVHGNDAYQLMVRGVTARFKLEEGLYQLVKKDTSLSVRKDITPRDSFTGSRSLLYQTFPQLEACLGEPLLTT